MRRSVILALVCAVAATAEPTIVAFGDSITEGFGVAPQSSYPAQLERALQARGFKGKVVNAGVSGDTTNNGLDRLPRVLAIQPHVVILELGGNDGLRGLPVASTQKNLDEMIAAFRKQGARVLLVGMTLPSNYGAAYVAQFEKVYTDLAAKHKIRLVSARSAAVLGGPGLMQQDGIHPTAAGYTKFVDYLLPFVEQEMRATKAR